MAKRKKRIIIHWARFLTFLVIVVLILAMGIFLINLKDAGASGNGSSASNSAKTVQLKDRNVIRGIRKIPAGYQKPAKKQGKVRLIHYDTTLIDGTGRTVRKTARVYLPYGYKKSKKYNIVYLVHGYGGHDYTYLGTNDDPRPFRNILDHMIQEGDIEPIILVTPTLTLEYTDYYTELNGMDHEIAHELMEAVESKYSTYAEDTSEEGYRASRNHRAFAGFSMGSSVTWRLLRDHADYAKYYLNMSMPLYYTESGYDEQLNTQSAQAIVNGIEASGVTAKDYKVFAASGTKDFMCKGTEQQVEALAGYTKWFTKTSKGFDKGNIMFHAWKGREHHYYEGYPYLYNALIRFFKDDSKGSN
ncbi:MAG: alpha/beta hydrolase [Anaerovoracaceae bacterium]|jgi:hypothetical protein